MNDLALHRDASAPAGRAPHAARTSVGRWLAGGGFVAALLAAYVALVPSVHLLPGTGLYDEKRLLQLVVLGAAALTLLCSPAARGGWLRTFGALPRAARAGLGVVLALGLLSAALAPMPRYAFLEVGHWALLFVLTVSVAQGVRALRSRPGFQCNVRNSPFEAVEGGCSQNIFHSEEKFSPRERGESLRSRGGGREEGRLACGSPPPPRSLSRRREGTSPVLGLTRVGVGVHMAPAATQSNSPPENGGSPCEAGEGGERKVAWPADRPLRPCGAPPPFSGEEFTNSQCEYLPLPAILGGGVHHMANTNTYPYQLERGNAYAERTATKSKQLIGERPAETVGRLVVGVVVLSALLYVVTFLVGYAMYLWGGGLLWPEAFNGFSNRRFFNQYQTWTLPFLVAAPLLWAGRPRTERLALGSLCAVWWALLIASGGRGVALAAGVATLGVGLMFRRAAWPWMRQQGAALAGGTVLFALLFKVIARAPASLLERDLARQGGRPPAWGDALEMAMQHPLLGAGPLHYAFQPFASIWAHPHQALLQWAAEWGLLSTAIVLALALWGLTVWMRWACAEVKGENATPACATVRVALTAALLGGAAHAMVSGLIVTPLSQLLMVGIVGGAWGLMPRAAEAASTPASPPWRHRLLQGALALALCAVAVGVAPDAPALQEKEDAYIEAYQPRALWPRYWQQGFIGY